MKPRTLDLFCGGGGSSWGARDAGADIVAGIDSWELASNVFSDNFPKALAINQNVNGKWLDGVLPVFGDVDLVIASPECTNHTCARGSLPRDESSRNTARYVLRYSRALQPRWLVIENVVHMKRWDGYESLIGALAQDYHVKVQALDAADFGVPQTRRRLFLLCDRLREPQSVLPTHLNGRRAHVRDILDSQGVWRAQPLFTRTRASATRARAERAIRALGRGVPFLIVYYGSDAAGGWQSLDRPLRTLTTLDRFGLVEWDGKVPTLRMLQVPELKRAMGFDESFKLDRGTRRDRIMILGNGVSPPVMRAVVNSLTGASKSAKALPGRLAAVRAAPVL